MKRGTLIGLSLCVLVLAVLIQYLRQEDPARQKRQTKIASVLRLAGEDTTELTVVRGDLRIECVKRDNAWFLRYPLCARADSGEIARILSAFELVPKREVITPAERELRDLKLSDYGFDEPRARILLRTGTSIHELLIGADAPVGHTIYVKLASGDDVIATDRDLLDVLPSSAEQLRDRTVLHGDPARTVRLEIRRPNSLIQLSQSGGEWTIQQPFFAWADRAKVVRLLDAIYDLRIERFVWDPPLLAAPPAGEPASTGPSVETTVRTATYGLSLDTATMRLQVWVAGDPLGQELLLGKPVDEKGTTIYAKLRDNEAVYAVGRAILDVFSVGPNDLRNPTVFRLDPAHVKYVQFRRGDHKLTLEKDHTGRWLVMEPVQWKADFLTVESVVNELARLKAAAFVEDGPTNLALLGLQPPAWSVQMLSSNPGAIPPEGRFAAGSFPIQTNAMNRLLVAAPRANCATVFAQLEGNPSVFELPLTSLQRFTNDVTDPLMYRDRTVLSIPAESIRKITLLKNHSEQTVVKVNGGSWSSLVPATNDVEISAIEDVLLLVANLRALQVAAHNPKNLAPFGLQQPETMLTLGLGGEEGIQKTIVMGSRSENGGIYAMVQGQDIVFVLPPEVVACLTRDLVKFDSPSSMPSRRKGGS